MIFKGFEKDIRKIGFVRMPETSNAKAIKTAIEEIVNDYEFDKLR